MDRIEIYSSRKKALLLLIGSVVAVSLGVFCIKISSTYDSPKQIICFLTGIVSILFFGIGIFIGIKNLTKNKLVLVLDEEGITINPKKPNEKIDWNDIEGFFDVDISGTKIVMIGVYNPEYWINKEMSKIRKKLMEYNYNHYDSPFCLSSNNMKVSHEELFRLLDSNLTKHTK